MKNRADQEEYQSRTQRDAATQVRKAQIETLVKDDEQSIETTGIGVDNLDVGEIGDVLGPERAAEHAQRRETALAKYEAKQGLESLTDEEIAARVDALAPQPGMDGYAAQRDIHETVSKRAAEIADLREKDPALAVEQTPEVQSALAEIDALNAEQQQAGAPGVTTGAPEQIGKIARARMAAQERIGIEEAPLTRRESKALLSRVIKTDPSKTDQGWIEVINDVEATYGRELGKKVLATALGYELKEDKDEAPIIANWIGKVARGEGITDQDLAQFHEMRALKASQGFMNNYSSARFDSPAMTALGVAGFEESEAGTPRTPGMRGASKSLPRQPIPKAAKEALKLYPDRADEFMRKYGLTREEIEKIIAK